MEIENAKRYRSYDLLAEIPDGALLLIQDGNAIKTITASALKSDIKDAINAAKSTADAVDAGATAHNAIYRGKNLGEAVTAAQYATIGKGQFEDMYIGDYWVIGGVTYRIAAFDYYYHSGDTSCQTHHVTLVPDMHLYMHAMNDTNSTVGAYVGSKMYTQGLTQAKEIVNTAFGANHVLNHRQYLPNAVDNGFEVGGSWYDSTVELMTEENLYGGKVHGNIANNTTLPHNHTIDKSQYPLFKFRPDLICTRTWFWLRDVGSPAYFVGSHPYGTASSSGASAVYGVRPAFSIKE